MAVRYDHINKLPQLDSVGNDDLLAVSHSGSCDHEDWTKLWMDGTVLMAGDTACPDNEDDGLHDYFLPAGSYWLEGDLTTDKTIIIKGEVDL